MPVGNKTRNLLHGCAQLQVWITMKLSSIQHKYTSLTLIPAQSPPCCWSEIPLRFLHLLPWSERFPASHWRSGESQRAECAATWSARSSPGWRKDAWGRGNAFWLPWRPQWYWHQPLLCMQHDKGWSKDRTLMFTVQPKNVRWKLTVPRSYNLEFQNKMPLMKHKNPECEQPSCMMSLVILRGVTASEKIQKIDLFFFLFDFF